MCKLLLLVESPAGIKKKRFLLSVMCAQVATGGGSILVAFLFFSSRVFKLHGVGERVCKSSLGKL